MRFNNKDSSEDNQTDNRATGNLGEYPDVGFIDCPTQWPQSSGQKQWPTQKLENDNSNGLEIGTHHFADISSLIDVALGACVNLFRTQSISLVNN
jgi:hypothetical protein